MIADVVWLVVVAALASAAWWYAVFGRAHREKTLIKWFPPLASRGPRPVSLIADPLMTVESSLPDAEGYAGTLQQLIDVYDGFVEHEESLASSREVVAAAQSRVDASARRIEAARSARFLKRVRTAVATKRFRKAKALREVAQMHEERVSARVSEAVASLRTVESSVATAQGEWERMRSFREKHDVHRPAFIESDTLLVMFFDIAKPKTIARLLRQYRLQVVTGTPSLSLFVVRPEFIVPAMSDDSQAVRLGALARRLRNEKIVEAASQNLHLEAATVAPLPSVSSSSGALAVSRFPEAWQFNRLAGATRTIDVGVLDVGFVDTDDVMITPIPGFPNQEDPHGTEVAAIIGAKPGNGIGIDGAAPFANIVGVSPTGALFDEFVSLLDILLRRTPELRVINASVSYNWGEKGIVPRLSAATRVVVANNGKMIRKSMSGAPRTVLVTAAGNDCKGVNCQEPATWASPYNWAALGPESLEDGESSRNIIVVEGLNASGTGRLPISNIHGMIRAVGERVLTIGLSNAVTAADGTSAAAPLVTAAIALMLQLNPGLTGEEIRTNLGIATGTVPDLDALEAVRRSAPEKTVH
jgi:hypothetical protein